VLCFPATELPYLCCGFSEVFSKQSKIIVSLGIQLHPFDRLCKFGETLVPTTDGKGWIQRLSNSFIWLFWSSYPNYVIDQSAEKFCLTNHTSNPLKDVIQQCCPMRPSGCHWLWFSFWDIQLVSILSDNIVQVNFVQLDNDFSGFGVEFRMLVQCTFKGFCHRVSPQAWVERVHVFTCEVHIHCLRCRATKVAARKWAYWNLSDASL